MNNMIKNHDDFLAAIGMALFGGAVGVLNQNHARWSWRWFFTGLFTAAFTGFVVYFALEGMGIDDKTKSALVGMAGYAANDLLNIFKQRLLDTLKGGNEE